MMLMWTNGGGPNGTYRHYQVLGTSGAGKVGVGGWEVAPSISVLLDAIGCSTSDFRGRDEGESI